ncbi:hypothetical protein HanPSC8_Chr01g0036531 [Helianthus annuus]|nr:hypothetical protein HanPSC8_Chr01g0036531 [Helianthus annuus]
MNIACLCANVIWVCTQIFKNTGRYTLTLCKQTKKQMLGSNIIRLPSCRASSSESSSTRLARGVNGISTATNTSGCRKHEIGDGAVWVFESYTSTADGTANGFNCFVLTDDTYVECFFHFEKTVRFVC